MRLRNILSLAFGVAVLTGCKEVTATHRVDTVTVTPVHTGGWQVALQSNTFGWADPVYAVKTDAFHRPTANDFFLARSQVIDLRNNKDTIWVGFSIYSWLIRSDFVGDSVTWKFSSSMVPSNPGGISFGPFNSLYFYEAFDANGQAIGAPMTGSHPVNVIGNDFEYSKRVSMRNISEVSGATVVYRPMTCGEHASRQLISNGITETQADSVKQYTYRLGAPSITMTCNPKAPTALRSSAEIRIRLVDHLRSQIKMLRASK